MLNRNDALALVLKGCTEKFEQLGFTSASVCENGDEAYVDFTKDDITIRLVSHDNLLDVTEKSGDGDFVKTESNLLDLDEFDEIYEELYKILKQNNTNTYYICSFNKEYLSAYVIALPLPLSPVSIPSLNTFVSIWSSGLSIFTKQ